MLDILAHRFAPPFFAVNDDVAIRNFKKSMKLSEVSENEYELFQTGSFDMMTGIFTPLKVPVKVYIQGSFLNVIHNKDGVTE